MEKWLGEQHDDFTANDFLFERRESTRRGRRMATTKGMPEKLTKQVKSANMKRANAFSQAAKLKKKDKAK